MPLLTPDFSEDTSGPIPPGSYPARITAVEAKPTQKGEPMEVWKLELFGDHKWVGRQATLYTSHKAGWGVGKLRQLYKAAMGEELQEKKGFDTDSLVGKEVLTVLVEGKTKDGQISNYPDVKAVLPYQQ